MPFLIELFATKRQKNLTQEGIFEQPGVACTVHGGKKKSSLHGLSLTSNQKTSAQTWECRITSETKSMQGISMHTSV